MMNEFTKEELGEIFWILEGCTMDFIGKEDDVLINKIRLMIDNYCECHEWILKFDAINSIYRECMNCKEKSK